MIKTLIDPARVIDLAYSNVEYTPQDMVSVSDIVAAEVRYLLPVIGEALYSALSEGCYPLLLSDYVAPALALFVREVADTPTAPRSKMGLAKARAMMVRLSDFLDANSAEYVEYDPTSNILKRCRLYGTHIQVH